MYSQSIQSVTSPTNPWEVTRAALRVSDRYSFVSSQEIHDIILYHGLTLRSRMSQTKGDRVYGKHLSRYSFPSHALGSPDMVSCEGVPELIIYNSHNGSSSTVIMLGYLRIACMNGLFIGSSFGTYEIRHARQDARELVESALRCAIARIPLMMSQVQQWQSQMVTSTAKAILIDEYLRIIPEVPAIDLMACNREADLQNTLWNIFNTVQENIMRGGQRIIREGQRAYTRKGIKSLSRMISVNRELWDVTQKFYTWLQG